MLTGPDGGEVLPYSFDHLRIDSPDDVLFFWLFLGVQDELDGRAVRPERLRLEDVEPFANGVGLGQTLLERERVNGGDFDFPAERLQPREPRLEMLDRRQRDALCIGRAASDRRPETLG